MKWLDKKVAEVLRQWKSNQLSYGAALGELHNLGWSVDAAGALLART